MNMAAVSVPPKFLNLMESARDKKETGKLYAYYKDEAMIHIGLLFFNKGRLCGCRFDKITGMDAIKTLFHTAIATAMFVRVGKTEVEEQDSMPDVDAIISTLKHERDNDVAPWSMTGTELYQTISVTLTDILGEKGKKMIDKVAAGYPPEENAKVFGEECIKMTANYLGMKRAREILDPIFE